MKIKLAILEKDQSYLQRIVSVFGTKYSDKFELYSFTEPSLAMQTIETNRVDVFIATDSFDIDMSVIPKRCGFAFLVDSSDIDTVRGQQAICKFQKADLIYKQILSIYSENAGSVSGVKLNDEGAKVIVFSSPNGGVGTSSMAAACASHFASNNKKSLYLNVEKFGCADPFFFGEGSFDFSDVIYALKSKKANLAMKLESSVRQATNGVYFYSQSKIALDMLELNAEDIITLISELRLTGSYEYIIVDIDFCMNEDVLKIYRQAYAVVWVGDGSELSNMKIQRAYSALAVKEQNEEDRVTDRLCMIYNKFSNKTSKTVGALDIKDIGGAPVYMHASTKQVVEQIAPMSMFDNII